MKKLLLAALLAVGAISFGAEMVELNTDGNANTVLPISVRGKVVEPTGLSLLITPTVSSSADGRGLDLNFGDIVKGRDSLIPSKAGEFEIEVLNASSQPIAIDGTLTVALDGGTAVGGATGKHHTIEVKNAKQEKLVDLDYVYQGAMSGEKKFKGKVEVMPRTEGAAATGLFTATAVNLNISIEGQTDTSVL